MNKHFKKILATALVIVLALSLSGTVFAYPDWIAQELSPLQKEIYDFYTDPEHHADNQNPYSEVFEWNKTVNGNNDLEKIIRQIRDIIYSENMQWFYGTNTFGMLSLNKAELYASETLAVDYRTGNRNMANDISEAYRRARELACQAYAKTTDYERIEFIHDWLIDNNEFADEVHMGDVKNSMNPSIYEYSISHLPWTALSGLDPNMKSVCEGYSRAFKMICDELGYPCLVVSGNGHAWNYIKLSGKWYVVDTQTDECEQYDSNGVRQKYQYAELNKHNHLLIGKQNIRCDLPSNQDGTNPLYPILADDDYDSNSTTLTPLPDPADKITVSGISINKNTLTMTTKKSSLSATISPSNAALKDVLWQSSDDKTVRVTQSGTLEALKEGTAIITASSYDGNKQAKCTVTVTKSAVGGEEENNSNSTTTPQTNPESGETTTPVVNPQPNPESNETQTPIVEPEKPAYVSAIGLNTNEAEMFEGEIATATLPANTKATIKSKNTKVAKVKYSKKTGVITITGKNPGTATVTVKVGKTTETINVNVKAKPFTINTDSVNVNYKQKVDVFTISKKNIKVVSDNPKIATAKYNKSKGKITIEGKSKGNTTVTVTYGDIIKHIAVNATATTTKLKLPKKANISKVGKSVNIVINATPKKNITGEIPEISVDNPDVISYEYNEKKNKIIVTGLQSGTANVKIKVGEKEGSVPVIVK